jgi:Ca2+-binding RTX toxin-like protein
MFVFHRKALTGIGITAAVVASTALISAPAQAATAGAARVSGTTVYFNALLGKANGLTITISGRTITLDDRVALKAGRGCKAVRGDKTKVKCTTSKKPTRLNVALGDKNDTVRNKTAVKMLVDGGAGNDIINGGSDEDMILGAAGNDKLYGHGGDDQLYGGAGHDSLSGGAGDGDILVGGFGTDNISGGPGANDFAYYGDRTRAVVADLDGARGDDGQRGEKDTLGADVESLWGGSGNDTLGGGAAANVIVGDAGNDTIRGAKGIDTLVGLAGNDKLFGDAGHDTLIGEDAKNGAPSGNPSATDALDGGADIDLCLAFAAATTVNCEEPSDPSRARVSAATSEPVTSAVEAAARLKALVG